MVARNKDIGKEQGDKDFWKQIMWRHIHESADTNSVSLHRSRDWLVRAPTQ